MISKLSEGLSILGIEASDKKLGKLEAYINELELWNSRLNLVSVENTEQLIIRHILDCLAGMKEIEKLQGKTIADIGSGAGLPGLLLAIFMEDHRFSLVERSGKKSGFLLSTAALLGMVERVEVVDADLKTVKGAFDIVMFRAFRDLGEFYKNLKSITAENGSIAAYKGRKSSIENDLKSVGIDNSKVRMIPLEVPFLNEERNLLLMKPWH